MIDIDDVINMVPLDNSTTDIAQKIIAEDDIENVKNLTH